MRGSRFFLRLIIVMVGGALAAGCTMRSAERPGPTPALLPLPASVQSQPGRLTLGTGAFIAVPAGDAPARNAAERLAALLSQTHHVQLTVGEAGSGPIRFVRGGAGPAESYRLEVTPAGATISAGDAAGMFYGAVTLWQLLTPGPDGRVSAAAITVDDAPRFGWRGLMLDSARHYQTPEFIKQLIDWMAVSKLNRLHWHLTDDQGWRLEIRKYPKLTEVGAWRVPAGRAPANNIDPSIGKPKLYGGYYTQAQVRDIVAHAAARQVTIVPEIGVPGHATAAIAAYPALGVTATPPAAPSADWGVFANLYNVEESTFAFLEDVLAEVVELFPGRFIHIGGDEAVKDQWRASPQVQARMAALGVRDEAALQGHVNRRMQAFLAKHGRRLIGWDEIIEAGLPEDATVMSWRGIDGAITAASRGHDTVLSPAPTLYFDHRQASTPAEPPGRGKVITLRDVFDFEPVPDRLTADQKRHVLGLQGNLWTEHVRTEARVEHQAFPRALAIAELGWAGKGRDWPGFVDRLLPQLDRLRALGLDPAPSAFAVNDATRIARGRVAVELSNQIGSDIRYTLDGSPPTAASMRYAGPLDLPVPSRLRAVAFHDGRALPGGLDRRYDALSLRRKDDAELRTCTDKLTLALEDDAPIEGRRAVLLTDIMHPCWIYADAPLDDVAAIEVTVAQLPFNFQIGKDIENIGFRPPATPAGEIEVRLGCTGDRIAVLPLAPATRNDGLTMLRAPIAARPGAHDLCFTYTAAGVEPMWAIDAVQLVPAEVRR